MIINNFCKNYPILIPDSDDFVDSVEYKVIAKQNRELRKLYVTHYLGGESYIYKLIISDEAKFSVNVFYERNRIRQNFTCDKSNTEINLSEKKITATQTIDIDYSYAPDIMAGIFCTKETQINVDNQSGLVSFWNEESFKINKYARIGIFSKLSFGTSDIFSLIKVEPNKTYSNGSVRTVVDVDADINDSPIVAICALDVFQELRKVVLDPKDIKSAFRTSIITQILSCVYCHMHELVRKDSYDESKIHRGLRQHLNEVNEKTKQDWESEDFVPSLAATRMVPYAIKTLHT